MRFPVFDQSREPRDSKAYSSIASLHTRSFLNPRFKFLFLSNNSSIHPLSFSPSLPSIHPNHPWFRRNPSFAKRIIHSSDMFILIILLTKNHSSIVLIFDFFTLLCVPCVLCERLFCHCTFNWVPAPDLWRPTSIPPLPAPFVPSCGHESLNRSSVTPIA